MSAASLELLKGNKAKAAPAPAPEPEPEEVAVDVDAMSSKELDKLVADNGIEVPTDTWPKMKVAEKRSWLKAQFEEAPAEEPAAEAAVEETAEEATEEPAPASVAAAPVKGKPGPKPKNALATAAVSGEVLGPDQFTKTVQEVESLKEKDAKALVGKLANETGQAAFKLGGVLSRIQKNSWFAPYPSLKEYIETEHGILYRRAMTWLAMYDNIVESGISFAAVSELGWSKIAALAEVMTPENVDEWVKVAKTANAETLKIAVKEAKKGDRGSAEAPAEVQKVTRLTFGLFDPQLATVKAAIAKAMEVSKTESTGQALEYIAMEYANGTDASLSDRLAAAGAEAAFEAFGAAFGSKYKIDVTEL